MERSLADIERVKKSIPVHMLGPLNTRERVRDELIKNAMSVMKSADPWDVETFLAEVAEPDWNSTFDIIDQGKISRILHRLVFIAHRILEKSFIFLKHRNCR